MTIFQICKHYSPWAPQGTPPYLLTLKKKISLDGGDLIIIIIIISKIWQIDTGFILPESWLGSYLIWQMELFDLDQFI